MALYLLERLFRIRRGNRLVLLKRVKWIAPVLSLEFCPANKDDFAFTEGQYLYLNCPAVSPNEVCPVALPC